MTTEILHCPWDDSTDNLMHTDKGDAFMAFSYDVRTEFSKVRVKVHVTLNDEPYDWSIVNMDVKNADGSVCKEPICAKICKQVGDNVHVIATRKE
jgi:hypothetical protein